jgi:hypothetical protein
VRFYPSTEPGRLNAVRNSHPYNPLKSLTHPFEGSPKGSVTLTRSTVLILSGWSNTQFSYWARRAEAISVLGQYDDRLLNVGTALKRRLRGELDTCSTLTTTDLPERCLDAQSITGKGLDVIIDDVKKRTGMSQFLRGKHSSLDPFGSVCMDREFGVGVDGGLGGEGMESRARTVVFNATFQAVAYEHSPPPVHTPSKVVQQRRGRGRGKGADRAVVNPGRKAGSSEGEVQQVAFVMSSKHTFRPEGLKSSTPMPSASTSPTTPPPRSSPFASDGEQLSVGSATIECNGGHDQGVQIPTSDSRSELELEDGLRKRKIAGGGLLDRKRLKASGM